MSDDISISPDFNEFDAELPGYYEDRSRAVTNRPRGRMPFGEVRARTVRGTLPHHYSGGIRNKYSIPCHGLNTTDRRVQLQQRVNGMKEKLESLEQMSSSQLTNRMERLV